MPSIPFDVRVVRAFLRHAPAVPTRRAGAAAALATIAAVLLLAVLAHLAQGVIERRVHATLRIALDAAGDGWVDVMVAGQSATLGGREPRPGRGAAALQRVRGLACPTWTGLRPCVAQVDAAFVAAAGVGVGPHGDADPAVDPAH